MKSCKIGKKEMQYSMCKQNLRKLKCLNRRNIAAAMNRYPKNEWEIPNLQTIC